MLLLTACGPVGDGDDSGTSGSGGAVRDGGMMTVALADDPDMLDPTLARTLVGRMVFMSMCEKLYDIDQKLNVVPQLAASPPTIDVVDPATVRIRLSQPFAPLAAVLADRSGMVMSPKQLDELGADFGSSEPSNFWHHGQ